MSFINYLTKDWRRTTAAGLVCFVGFAAIGAHVGSNENGVTTQRNTAIDHNTDTINNKEYTTEEIENKFDEISIILNKGQKESIKIGQDEIVENIKLIEYNWKNYISGISQSQDINSSFVKDLLYAVWLSGYKCNTITGIKYSSKDLIRNSVSEFLENPQLARLINMPGRKINALNKRKIELLEMGGNKREAMRMLIDHISPLIEAGKKDLNERQEGGATVRCGNINYRVSSTLGSDGILVAVPL